MANGEGVHVTLDNSEGISEKTAAVIGLVCLLAGLSGGAWLASRWLRYTPSEEYYTEMAALDSTLAHTQDSLEATADALETADREVERLLSEWTGASRGLEETRIEAAAARRRADSLAAAAADTGDREVLRESQEAQREALKVTVAECELCAANLRQMEHAVTALRAAVAVRDDRLRIMERENAALANAILRARAEVDRANGKFNKWLVRGALGATALTGIILIAR